MCFSPEASFAAAVVIGGIGYASLRAVKTKSLILLALIPCFFAIQQLAEGIVWLYLQQTISSTFLSNVAKNIYLFIAFALWPTWIPFSIWANEKRNLNKWILLLILILGILTAIRIIYIMSQYETNPSIVGNSIQYEGVNSLYGKLAYASIIIASSFVSTLRYMWLFGIVAVLSFVVTEFFYSQVFTSVWCFFAAILCIFIYFIIRKN